MVEIDRDPVCDFCRSHSVSDSAFYQVTGSLLDCSACDNACGNFSGILGRKRL